jgi:1-acyl-sn-glycerol-3-phosphate acyltransferase
MIFPEGTRARIGELGVFRPGGTMALLEEAPDTPVVPVAIDQSWRLLTHNFFPVPWGIRVRVYIGDPIPRRPGEDATAVLEQVREEIAGALARWRGDPPAVALARARA